LNSSNLKRFLLWTLLTSNFNLFETFTFTACCLLFFQNSRFWPFYGLF
jgi:hypothetical protein